MRRDSSGTLVMRTNGKYEGTDAPSEFQDVLALVSGLYLERYGKAALVGLGPGRTLRALAEMPFGTIEVGELTGVVEAAPTSRPVRRRAARRRTTTSSSTWSTTASMILSLSGRLRPSSS